MFEDFGRRQTNTAVAGFVYRRRGDTDPLYRLARRAATTGTQADQDALIEACEARLTDEEQQALEAELLELSDRLHAMTEDVNADTVAILESWRRR
ncbi:hypothetical protein CKO28_09800 [Rhodovibrio sodomensis]|uniref:Uncharacterized protein n=2 Tax=Rhodovibrio sodomensis TaxID=1088 RepID=A0ABS1DDY9_9PROT|nr:hypothetical protein [Rhodovibrio sodomensis]